MKFGPILLALFSCISGATCGVPCGGKYTQSQGEFFSPKYPSNYPNNAYCVWRLQSPRGQVVSLNFIFVDLEKDWDVIIVYDGPTEQDQHLHSVTGNQTTSFISSSRHVTIIFFSDNSNNQKGFRAEWAFIDGVPCGENLTQSQGEFFSPSYPNNYPNDAYCVWKLQSLSGQVVSLNFTFVDLEMKSDEIYVYDGPTDQDQRLGIVTGNQGTSFRSSSRYMTVVFHSDSSWTQQGFRAEWSFIGGAPCGGNLTQSQGEFFSPNYPNNYPNNAKCIWRLQSPEQQVVSLNFTFVDLESLWDSVHVYDGLTDEDPHLGAVTENQTTSFISSSSYMTVIFSSDWSNSQKGFRAEWAFIDGASCGGVLTQSQGEFFSPNYPDNYPNNAYCAWRLQSPRGQVVSLNFTFIDLKMESDVISVYDGPTDQDQHLGIVTGNQGTSFSSSSRYLTVVFRSDSSVTQGFRAKWSFIGGAACGGNLTHSQGNFVSPKYPNNYPNNAYCVWRLQSPRQHVVSLIFTFVDLEMESDVICVYDGPTDQDQRLGIVTGNQGTSFSSSSRYMTVVFHSDSSRTQQGFRAEWSFLGGAPCGGNLTQSGEFFSPNYPNNYPNNADCVWTLQSPEQQVVSLIFTFVDLESLWDSVHVYDGLTDEDPHLGAVTENQTTSFISSSSYMTVIFSSDESENQKGFRAEWAFIGFV